MANIHASKVKPKLVNQDITRQQAWEMVDKLNRKIVMDTQDYEKGLLKRRDYDERIKNNYEEKRKFIAIYNKNNE